MPYTQRNSKRSAVHSIRGYGYQLLHTVKRCLELKEHDLLVGEGNEDIDRELSNLSIEEQIKLRSAPLAWSTAMRTLLNFAIAFQHHDLARRRFLGILRTNVSISRGPSTAVRRWIEGRRPNRREILRELRREASQTGTTEHQAAVSYLSQNDRSAAFVSSVEWALVAPGPDEVEAELKTALEIRAPELPPNDALAALLAHVLALSSETDITARTVTKLDVDFLLNDLLHRKLVRDFRIEARADMFSLASVHSEIAAVAVIVLAEGTKHLSDVVTRALRGREIKAGSSNRSVAIAEVLDKLELVACASVKIGGPSRRAVCVRDVLRQAKQRWNLQTVVLSDEGMRVDGSLVRRILGQTQIEVDDQSDLMLAASLIAESILQCEAGDERGTAAIEDLAHKLRWLHRIDTGEYFTAAFPYPCSGDRER